MDWTIRYTDKALKDLEKLDNSARRFVLKAIQRVSANPLPNYEGGYGKPLGNKGGADLTGYCKIKLSDLGLRVVYEVIRQNEEMKIIIISVRDDDAVYKMAASRIREHDKLIH